MSLPNPMPVSSSSRKFLVLFFALIVLLLICARLKAQNLDGTGAPPPKQADTREVIPYSELKNLLDRSLPVHPMTQPPLPPSIHLLFNTPKYNGHIEDYIVDKIEKAQSEVLFNQYAITSQRIADALVAAHARKCTVVGLIDPSPDIPAYTAPSYFITNNIAIFYNPTASINNNKYCIIDRKLVITGSYDWTNASLTSSENALEIEDPAIVVAYFNAFVSQLSASNVPRTVAALFGAAPAAPPTTSQMPDQTH